MFKNKINRLTYLISMIGILLVFSASTIYFSGQLVIFLIFTGVCAVFAIYFTMGRMTDAGVNSLWLIPIGAFILIVREYSMSIGSILTTVFSIFLILAPSRNDGNSIDGRNLKHSSITKKLVTIPSNNGFVFRGIKQAVFIVIVLILVRLIYVELTQSKQIDINQGRIKCSRLFPYKLSPEFERARSLRVQRMEENGVKVNKDWYNCINIEYSKDDSLNDKLEGYFYFDQSSSLDKLTIYVNPRYKIHNDLITALLISHEIVHVSQYIDQIETGKKLDCFEKEAEARVSEIMFYNLLNVDEKRSIAAVYDAYANSEYEADSSFYIYNELNDLLGMHQAVGDYCNNLYKPTDDNYSDFRKCYYKYMPEIINKYLKEKGTYDEQCNNNSQ